MVQITVHEWSNGPGAIPGRTQVGGVSIASAGFTQESSRSSFKVQALMDSTTISTCNADTATDHTVSVFCFCALALEAEARVYPGTES